MIPLKSSITDLLQEHNQKLWLGSSLLMQILGFFADNAVAMISILAGSIVPLIMSIRSQRQKQRFEELKFEQELGHKKRMDDIEYEKALIDLNNKKA